MSAAIAMGHGSFEEISNRYSPDRFLTFKKPTNETECGIHSFNPKLG